jgi:colanic acid/amylovoran biosynthesis glycosyltransferase
MSAFLSTPIGPLHRTVQPILFPKPVLTVAYLANQFPAGVEPYVGEEIQELRQRGLQIIPGSVRRRDAEPSGLIKKYSEGEILYLQPVRVLTLLRALVMALRRWERIADLVKQVLRRGTESPTRRIKALLHTWLGACYAVLLQDREVDHIHVHHGYFGSWIAMVAARLLEVNFSLTLHGSDLLLDTAYLEKKLENCRFCVTISEYNRRYIAEHFPAIDAKKIVALRLGVEVPERTASSPRAARDARRSFTLLAVGRLHAVKNHAFLVRGCARLRDHGLSFNCVIAGEGPERQRLQSMIGEERLQERLTLLGHVARSEMDSLYRSADVVVLTSRSEGIPLVLMEAMALGKIVLAPAITGIPELVISGKTGFLYVPVDLENFVAKILFLQKLFSEEDRYATSRLDWVRHGARVQIQHNFNRSKNLTCFGDRFLQLIAPDDRPTQDWRSTDEDPILQQI